MSAITATIHRLHRTGEHEQMFEFIKTALKKGCLNNPNNGITIETSTNGASNVSRDWLYFYDSLWHLVD